MSTKYISTYIPLTEGQIKKLARAINNSSEVSLLIDKHQVKKKGNTELYLTRYNKVKSEGKGITLSLSKTQISKMRKDMIGKGIQVTPPQGGKGMQIEYPYYPPPIIRKQTSKKYGGKIKLLSEKDALSYRSPPFIGTWDQYNKFLKTGGLVLPKKKDLKTKKVNKPTFIKKPLSNIDLMRWCKYLKINIKGMYSRDEHMSKRHSPCIINLDSYEGVGTHWTCCIPGHNKRTLWYFDSFGMPYPNEFKMRAEKDGIKQILYNSTQYQHIKSVLSSNVLHSGAKFILQQIVYIFMIFNL